MQDFIASNPFFKKFEVDELLFVEFQCPTDDSTDSIWWHNNMFAYILAGETRLKSLRHEYTLRERDCIFAKKGSITIQSHIQENFCELLVFVPDNFIRKTVQKYRLSLQPFSEPVESDTLIRLANDPVIDTYFHSLAAYFSQIQPPSSELLKLKFEELIINILSANSKYSPLKYYFRQLCLRSQPSVKEIMEANFQKKLSLEEYARLCGRSLSAFKQDFKAIFNTTPGKWLREKRLDYGKYLLETTRHSLDEICFLSGFENTSHFITVFKRKFQTTPGQFRKEL